MFGYVGLTFVTLYSITILAPLLSIYIYIYTSCSHIKEVKIEVDNDFTEINTPTERCLTRGSTYRVTFSTILILHIILKEWE